VNADAGLALFSGGAGSTGLTTAVITALFSHTRAGGDAGQIGNAAEVKDFWVAGEAIGAVVADAATSIGSARIYWEVFAPGLATGLTDSAITAQVDALLSWGTLDREPRVAIFGAELERHGAQADRVPGLADLDGQALSSLAVGAFGAWDEVFETGAIL